MNARNRKGKCEGCDKSPRVLTKIESGQWVCRTCLREIRGPKQQFVSPAAVASLRKKGFTVPDRLTREEYHRLADAHTRRWQLQEVRAAGFNVPDDAPLEELDRLWRIARLRGRGVEVSDSATLDEVEKREAIRHFHARVVGVSHANEDGTSRQRIIARCSQWEVLKLRHECDNPIDRNAVAVLRANGEQLGYLDRDLAEEIAKRLESGWRYFPMIKEIRTDGDVSHYLGVLLLLFLAQPGAPMDMVREYVARVVAQSRAEQ